MTRRWPAFHPPWRWPPTMSRPQQPRPDLAHGPRPGSAWRIRPCARPPARPCRRLGQSRQRFGGWSGWTRRWKLRPGAGDQSRSGRGAGQPRQSALDPPPGAGARHRRSGTGAAAVAGSALCPGRSAASENVCRRLARISPREKARLDEGVRAGKPAVAAFRLSGAVGFAGRSSGLRRDLCGAQIRPAADLRSGDAAARQNPPRLCLRRISRPGHRVSGRRAVRGP